MKKTGPPRPRPKPRARRVKKKEPGEKYTLYHQDLVVGKTTYRVFLRLPVEELGVITSAAVAAHLGGKKPVIVAVRAEVRELHDPKAQYVEAPLKTPVKEKRRSS